MHGSKGQVAMTEVGWVELAANSAMEGALPAAQQTMCGPPNDG